MNSVGRKLIGLVAGLLVLGVAGLAGATERVSVTEAESRYCKTFAELEYADAVERGDALPDRAYEGVAEECEFQWELLGAQWANRADLDRVAVLANKLSTLADVAADCEQTR